MYLQIQHHIEKNFLKLAKYNVENHYAVVGLAEEMELTLRFVTIDTPSVFSSKHQFFNPMALQSVFDAPLYTFQELA